MPNDLSVRVSRVILHIPCSLGPQELEGGTSRQREVGFIGKQSDELGTDVRAAGGGRAAAGGGRLEATSRGDLSLSSKRGDRENGKCV